MSKMVQFFTRCYYTHASIGLEEDMNTFCSFVIKGFRVEKITRYEKPDRESFPCMLYEMEVSDEVYDNIKNIVNSFVERKEELHYSKFGVVASIFQIPIRFKNSYFCSQFVAEVLNESHATYLKKECELYHPKDFEFLQGVKKVFQGNITGFMKKYEIAPAF
jgi:hypothetical protein